MGFVGRDSVEIECSFAEGGEIDKGLHRGTRLPQGLGDAVEVGIGADTVFVELSAARLSEDARITVPQYDHRALDHAAGARAPLLVQREAVLQCLVRNLLDAGVYRRVDLDSPLQQVSLR